MTSETIENQPDELAPIGVFDSGVGGLTVVSAIRHALPDESILYLGDTARLPYGNKSASTVERYTRRNVEFLLRRGVKSIVVACNTASAVALQDLDLPVPIRGVIEPGAAAAVAVTSGRIGVLGTARTIRSNAYGRAIARLRPEVEVISQACPLFVPLVEEGWTDDSITEQIAVRYLQPLLSAAVDTVVLGCTHYPAIEPMLTRILGPTVTIVDSGKAVAAELAAATTLPQSARGRSDSPRHHFCVTDLNAGFERMASLLLHEDRDDVEATEAGKAGDSSRISLEWIEV